MISRILNIIGACSVSVFLSMAISSCTSKAQDKPLSKEVENTKLESATKNVSSTSKFYLVEGDKVRIKPIQLYFEFTDALSDAIIDNNEEFEVTFEIYPNTERELPKFIEAYMDEKGSASLYEETISNLSYQRAHLLKDIVLDKKIFDAFDPNELYININIYSARKHFELNIIDGRSDANTVEEAVNNDITVKATLL